MLPPVRTSSFVDYQTPSQQPMLRQRIDVANTAANSGLIGSSPMSAGRLDILSLSAQLQLAQGFSIFAETIGRLIKVPRREGEALADYAQRLSEAVKQMNPAEKAALERTLNQLVKGITLRLLTEILNNPAGPEAARVAVQLETAQLLDRDLAAKAVVSSYRQNAGAEQVPAPPSQPANAAPPGQASQTVSEPPTEAEAQAAQPGEEPAINEAPQQEIAAGAAAHDADAPLVATTVSGTAQDPAALSAEAAVASPAPTDEVETQAQAAAETDLDATPAPVSLQEAAELAESETPEFAAVRTEETPDDSSSTARPEEGRQIASGANADRRMAQPVFYDGPALARLSQRGLEQPNGARALNAEKVANGATTVWLAEVLADATGELLDSLPVAARQLPEQQALQELTDREPAGRSPLQASEAASAAMAKPAPRADEPASTGSTGRAAGTAPNAGGQAAGTTVLAEQLALPMAMPHMFREGVALPYVAYPPEERERDPEERKTKAISPTDEDGEQQHSAGEQAFSDEGQANEHDQDDHGDDASKEAVEDADRANDLYWRMAGWT
ncbi:hypothetical protein [Neorhizobium galegae]|uniref:Uncharacterized protein n=1 Tax=Neorhizobium galegae bv. orientalis str. HAMBI 540 TaxID=1028800 RepID=A0A068SX95_NEOGA|nr:hypothetical protein [Neorhizobium galegae]CDN50396.1 Hypothetical protein RG540_CH42540 [Neorhizobium galegae bv. orientalis str. HAMBI 540]